MTDTPDGPRPWDLDQYRAATRAPEHFARPKRRSLQLDFLMDPSALFWDAFKGAFLTIFTLGLYRFWMITRLRRRYWGAVQIDGDPLEYTGTGLEKFLGFLLALVILALYLGGINLALAYAGLSYLSGDPWAQSLVTLVSVAATVPLIFYAIYRSHRYMLARTRWRGIRMGLEPGAWGYAWRAIGLTLLTALTLGLAYPYQQFVLAKYLTDRSWFGDLNFQQEGSWTELFAQWVWLYIVLGLGGILVWGMAENPEDQTASFFGGLFLSLGIVLLFILFQRYQIVAFRILWSNRRLDDAEFTNEVSVGKVLWIYVGGGIAVSVCTAIFAAIVFGMVFLLLDGLGAMDQLGGMLASAESEGQIGPEQIMAAAPGLVLLAVTYLAVFGAAFAFSQIFVTRPVLSAKVRAMELTGAERLAASQQRAHDHSAEAGGFADALGVDVGPGI